MNKILIVVVEARDGVTTLKVLDENLPDLVLMDVQMPEEDVRLGKIPIGL